MTESVLAHLALRFSTQPENIATEALGYILRRSFEAREALLGFLKQAEVHIEGPLTFRTQVVGSSGDRPDLVGMVETRFNVRKSQKRQWTQKKRGGRTFCVCQPAGATDGSRETRNPPEVN